jgi:hypothetical protein
MATPPTIISIASQCDGRSYVTELHVDRLGNEHRFTYLSEPDADIDAIMSARIDALEQQFLTQAEQENATHVLLPG